MAEDKEIYDRLVAVAKLHNIFPIEFDGQNCDDCDGWDGEDRRCNCGNRRVDWVLSDDKTYVYAEAY